MRRSSTNWLFNVRLSLAIPYAALALALALIAVLSTQVGNLRAEVDRYARRAFQPYPGMWVPTVRTATLRGDSVTVGATAPGRRQVLIVFKTTCEFCRQTLPAWKRLSAELLADTARPAEVLWLSLSSVDSTNAYVREHDIRFPVIKLPEEKLERVFRTNAVPVTVVLDETGRVIYSRLSVLGTQSAIDSVMTAARARGVGPSRPNEL
jgi:hypothetical protein